MRIRLADWLWRLAVLAVLACIAWQLQRLHEDIVAPAPDDTATASAAPDDVQDGLDAIRDDIAALDQKVSAIMVVMARGADEPRYKTTP